MDVAELNDIPVGKVDRLPRRQLDALMLCAVGAPRILKLGVQPRIAYQITA
jgi:hypothetical protein